jgi:hypothetical protein
MTQPLMPMATAVWLVDNTALTFKQIAEFCQLHELEVQGIADETVGANIVGQDPTASGQLSWDEINRCQADSTASLTLSVDDVAALPRTKGPRYTPVSKRQDKPDAIAWLVRNHPELSDLQISRLVGTTKPTIQAIRERSHWNIQNIKPQDPVGLGLCKQIELDDAVRQAAARRDKAAAATAAPEVAEEAPAGEDEAPTGSAPEESTPAAADVPADEAGEKL